MNCEYVHANAALLIYDELADDVKFEMEQHLRRCESCAEEVKALRLFEATMSSAARPEPSPNLLAAARIRLSEALESAPQARGWGRFTFDLAGWFHQVRLSPAVAMALLIVGFAGGAAATWSIANGRGQVRPGGDTAAEASIAGIRSVNPGPGNKVQIKYDKLVRESAEGSLDDPRIQQLLLYAAHSNLNSGVRMDSIDLLTRTPGDEKARSALIYALHYDTNPGVRQRAVEALRPWVRDDVRVRDAMLDALLNDASPGVRTEAIHAIQTVRADSSVRSVLRSLAEKDQNQYIRRKAQEVLNSTEID